MGLLDGRAVLVSGGTQGVGAGVARAAVREGALVTISGRRRETGETAPRPCRNRRGAKWLAYAEQITACVDRQPDITLRERAERLGHVVNAPCAYWA